MTLHTLHNVECRTPEREVGGSKPTAAVLCPWARHFTPRKYWLITQEALAPSRHDWKLVDWDVKPQHKQNKTPFKIKILTVFVYFYSFSVYYLKICLPWCLIYSITFQTKQTEVHIFCSLSATVR